MTWTYDAETGTLTGASPATGALTIPGTIKGCTITAIGDWAFGNSNALTSVTIPGSVTRIGDSAFYSCEGLTAVTLPVGLTDIGANAFSFCKRLASVTIPSSVESIGNNAFLRCDSLASVTIEAGVKRIGKYMFAMCTNLASVTVPASVESIGDAAFQACSALSSMTIEAGVETIGESVFFRCTQLTTLTIPGSVESIGAGVFGDSGLETLYVAAKYEGTGYLDETALPEGCTVVYGDPPIVLEGVGIANNEGRVTWTITFPGQEDVRYHVEWTRDLTLTNGWRDLGTMFVQQTYTNGTVTLQGVETRKSAFYRVMVPGE